MPDDYLHSLQTLASSLKGRATQAVETEVGASLDSRIDYSIDLIEHNEPGVALEDLAQNVYEFDLTLSLAEYQVFDRAGRSMRMSPERWTFLRELVEEQH